MSKPLILTMTQERYDDISQMISNIYPTFDGIVAVVNQPSNDGTYELLESNKGNGKIIKTQWTPHHGFLMNHLLFYGGIDDGRWCLYLDSPERITDLFIQDLPQMLKMYDDNGIGALYWDGRPYLFKYNKYCEFFGAVHWGLSNINGKIITSPDKDHYIINKRKEKPEISWCLNPIKYWVCYPLSEETYAMYGKYGGDLWKKHEAIRRDFRKYCIDVLKIDITTLDGLIDYMKKIESKEVIPSDYFIETVENEFRLSELYQLKVLNYDFMGERPNIPNGMHPRFKWSFKDHLQFGSGWYNKDYEGTILRYNKGES